MRKEKFMTVFANFTETVIASSNDFYRSILRRSVTVKITLVSLILHFAAPTEDACASRNLSELTVKSALTTILLKMENVKNVDVPFLGRMAKIAISLVYANVVKESHKI